ncbi:hypothetical protein ASE75_04440 [Sphingomonas sp. Leaf17]|uniref:hypothetical protein n=1 Tax=Sphingomonas sp. Leaf17 TaxID=1735683 RepID=UPI0006F7D970|nr:hypothetical protein [Sphingomonas sp. Leaf17]KQM65517.1 hypothetical protein ASE75_04440 [Sphingomonas sp. Leaf17]
MIRFGTTTWRVRLRVALEMIVLFAGLALLDWTTTGGTGFAGVQPNPLWLPVLVMALAYGTGAGIAAAAIASVLWLGHVHGNGGERDYLDYLFHLSLPPLLWFVAAVAIGEVTMIRLARHRRLERREGTARRNVARLTEAFHRLSRTNRVLQVTISTEARTVGHAIATATRLASIDPVERRGAVAHLIAMATRTEDFTCYRIVDGTARAWLRGATPTGARDMLPADLVGWIRDRTGILHVARPSDRDRLDGVGVAAIPLRQADGQVVGCLVLHTLPFTALTPHGIAEMTEVATWLTPLLADVARGSIRQTGPAKSEPREMVA